MSEFLDGPAQGRRLMLRQAPIVLRVTLDERTGECDALDMPEDKAKRTELVYLYVRVSEPMRYHIRCSPRSASGFYQDAKYRFVQVQPPHEVLADNERWGAWVAENLELLARFERWRKWSDAQG